MDNNIQLQNANANAAHNLNAGNVQVMVNPEIKIGNLTAQQFLETAEQNGWQDAKNDDVLRAFIVLFDENNQAMKNMANKIASGDYTDDNNSYAVLRDKLGESLLTFYGPKWNTNQWNNEHNNALKYLYTVYGAKYEVWAEEQQNVNVKSINTAQIDDSAIVQRFKPNPNNVVNNNNNEIHNENVNLNQNVNQNENIIPNENANVIPPQENNNNNNNIQENQPQVNPDLIPILDPNKQVNNLNWASFHQTMAAKGWKNAENSNTLRAFYNLCDAGEDRASFREMATLLLNREDAQNENVDLESEYKYAIQNAVRDSIILKAQNHQQFRFNEEERKSVLHFQGLLNQAGEHFDFNSYHPVPVAANLNEAANENNIQNNDIQNNNNNIENNNANNVIVNENENQNQLEANVLNQLNEHNQQNQQPEVQPQPGPQLKTREFKSVGVTKTLAEGAAENLKASTLRLRGSEEYKNVREQFIRVQERWNRATAQNGVIDEKEVLGLRDDLMNVMTLADIYLDKKYRDKDKSDNAKKRKIAVGNSFNILEEQLAIVNKRRDEIDKSNPPSLAALTVDSRNAMNKLEDATLRFRGSDEYKEAREAFDKARAKLQQLQNKYQDQEGNISTDELDETRDLLMAADDKLALYSIYKDGDVLKDNTHNRLDAVNEGRTVIAAGIRKLNALQAAKEAKPVQTLVNLRQTASDQNLQNFSNNNNVHFGSKAYEQAKDAYGVFFRKLNAVGGQNNIKPRDLDDLEKTMNEAEAKIDAYLGGKREKIEWDAKGTARIAGMRASKESIIETRRAVKEQINRRYQTVNAMQPATLQEKEREVLGEVRLAQNKVDGHSVWLGGKDYDAALEAYNKVCENERALDGNENQPSRHALKSEIEELTKAKDKILVYVRRKESEKATLEGKGKSLDAIGSKRLEVMNKAYDNVRIRLDRAQSKMDAIGEAAKNREFEELNKLWNDRMADVPNAEGSAKIVAMKSASNIKTLERLSRQEKLTEVDQKVAQRMVANLILSENIINGKFKPLNPPTLKNFDDIAGKIMESKDFTSVMPKEKLDPEACRNLLVGKKTLDGISKKVLNNMQMSGDKNKIKQSAIHENLQKENNAKKHVNPLLS